MARRLAAAIAKRGDFVEVGLGSLNYSFEWAAPMGYRCFAVEPLPSELLTKKCGEHRVDLTTAAIAAETGQMPIFLGTVDGMALPDVSSLDADWWGGSKQSRLVQTYTLPDFLALKKITAISVLKVDTEGSEFAVLNGLRTTPQSAWPDYIFFEYGGGGVRSAKTGGWADKFWAGTLNCAKLLSELGYASALLLETELEEPALVQRPTAASIEARLPAQATVGNMLFSRQPISEEAMREHLRDLDPALRKEATRQKIQNAVKTARTYRTRIVNAVKRRL